MTPFTILLVEDDANDVFFFERAYRKAEIEHPLAMVHDGQQAINYLSGADEFADRAKFPMPRLMVLDLNLPLKHGLDVLKWMRDHRAMDTIIVLVLTSSSAQLDIEEAYRFGANSYLVKPADPTSLWSIMAAIKQYWLTHNQLPPIRS